MKKNTTVLYIRGVPSWVRDFFKSWCAKRGSSMTEEIIKFMEDKAHKGKEEKLQIDWVNRGRR